LRSSAELEALFLQHLPVIDRAAAVVARRYGFSPDDAAELTSWIKLRIVEDDYAALRKFRGESSMGTYLSVVVAMLARDYRAAHWGRWRPSASARRLGEVAVRLETLVYRNGHSLQQAAELLRTAGLTTQTDRELAAMLAGFPSRGPLRPVEVTTDAIESMPSSGAADTPLETARLEEVREQSRQLLENALTDLSTEDRLIVRLRYWESLSVADIARGLKIDQKALYRRLERLLEQLRRLLALRGFRPEHLQELLDEPGR
jgi:RNA polymerase sigma factor for flagellar operon FliA